MKMTKKEKAALNELAEILDRKAKQMKIVAFNQDTGALDTIEGVCVNGNCLQINLESNKAMNKAAQELARMARGVPKTLTAKERRRRAVSLAVARAKRWPVKHNVTEQARCKASTASAGSAIGGEA